MQEDDRFFSSGFREASEHVIKLPYNNVDSYIHPTKIKRILLKNASHGTVLLEESSLIREIVNFSRVQDLKIADRT